MKASLGDGGYLATFLKIASKSIDVVYFLYLLQYLH